MYYLFLKRESDLAKYKAEFDRVYESIENGKTPVQNEMRIAKTVLVEAFPYQTLSGVLLVVGTFILDKMNISGDIVTDYHGLRNF